jgi:hypothetical protein
MVPSGGCGTLRLCGCAISRRSSVSTVSIVYCLFQRPSTWNTRGSTTPLGATQLICTRDAKRTWGGCRQGGKGSRGGSSPTRWFSNRGERASQVP